MTVEPTPTPEREPPVAPGWLHLFAIGSSPRSRRLALVVAVLALLWFAWFWWH
jgi:hypothetical protein